MKKIVLFGFLMLLFGGAWAQSKKIEKANNYLKAGEYLKALEIYNEVYPKLKDKNQKAEVSFNAGLCAKNLFNVPEQIKWFKRATIYKYQDPKAYLFLADAYKMKGLYDEAIKYYKTYQDLVPNDKLGEIGVKSCEQAKDWMEHPARFGVKYISQINSRDNDFAPAMGDDTLTLYFTSTRSTGKGTKTNYNSGQNFADIFVTQLDKKNYWTQPKPAEGDINGEFDDGSCTFTSNGLTMYYTSCKIFKNKVSGCKIYEAKWQNGKWTTVGEVKIFGDTSISVGQPALSPDELTMFFATDNPKGKGGKDIWYVTRSSKSGKWSNPQPVGGEVNTEFNEIYPFMDEQGNLYFASDRPEGMGGFDIYKATKKEGGTWKVENLRYPINSSANDFSLMFIPGTRRGYFASSRKLVKDDDIYQFWEIPLKITLVGYVMNDKNHAYLPDVTVKIQGSDGSNIIAHTNAAGKFEVRLKENVDYYLLASKPTFLRGHASVSTKGIKKDGTVLETEIYLIPAVGNIKIPNIYYDFNDTTLRPESYASLDKLIEILNINPDVKIEIRAHTDYRGSEERNLILSRGRANSVIKYLIQHGIDKDRLVAKGLGESEPFVVDKLTAKKYPFLKEGQKLTQQFIESLPSKEQQEICNELNRRTEFRVIEGGYDKNYERFGE